MYIYHPLPYYDQGFSIYYHCDIRRVCEIDYKSSLEVAGIFELLIWSKQSRPRYVVSLAMTKLSHVPKYRPIKRRGNKSTKKQQSKSLRQIDISPGRTTVALLFIRGGLGHIIRRQKKRLCRSPPLLKYYYIWIASKH